MQTEENANAQNELNVVSGFSNFYLNRSSIREICIAFRLNEEACSLCEQKWIIHKTAKILRHSILPLKWCVYFISDSTVSFIVPFLSTQIW